jgi:Uma2 family endonuclease
MSTVGRALVTWEQFLQWPDPEPGFHHELQNGEVVLVAPPRPLHLLVQSVLVEWLTKEAAERGRGDKEFPYRPAKDLQFWSADVAYVPKEDWRQMRGDEYPVYAPPLVVEVLSPSNRKTKIAEQRTLSFAAGTKEFWVIDTEKRAIQVFARDGKERSYDFNDTVPVSVLPGSSLILSRLLKD